MYFIAHVLQEMDSKTNLKNDYDNYDAMYFVWTGDWRSIGMFSPGLKTPIYGSYLITESYYTDPDLTIVHELLHAYGCGHTYTSNCIMNPPSKGGVPIKMCECSMIYQNDIDGKPNKMPYHDIITPEIWIE